MAGWIEVEIQNPDANKDKETDKQEEKEIIVGPLNKDTCLKMIAACEAGIKAILEGGQSYTIGDRTFNRGNLKDLQNLLDNYLKHYHRLLNSTKPKLRRIQIHD